MEVAMIAAFNRLWGDPLLSIMCVCFLGLIISNFRLRRELGKNKTALEDVKRASDTAKEKIAYYKAETLQFQKECKILFDLNTELSQKLSERGE